VSIAESADTNMSVHASWGLRAVPGAIVIDDPELVMTDSGLASDTFNIVCRARLSPKTAQHRIGKVVRHFKSRGRAFSWWVGPVDQPGNLASLLAGAGLVHAESETLMALDLADLKVPAVPPGLEIRPVASARDMEDFAAAITAGTAPDESVVTFYRHATTAMLSPGSPQWFYVGYVEGEPVATAEMTLAADVAGIYGVVTAARLRRRGIGSALTAAPLLDARKKGYRTAYLQASSDGLGVYEKLGFRKFGIVKEFKPKA
jgi:ribosomal protein S18 acetylase RimI-like enzyme